MRITIGFCTDNLEKDRDFMENMKSKCGLDVDFIPKVGYTSICKAYNEILMKAKTTSLYSAIMT